jgi:hypothetical protein
MMLMAVMTMTDLRRGAFFWQEQVVFTEFSLALELDIFP